jgi:integrase
MPRPATGSARWEPTKGCWIVRVTLTDGSRSKPIPLIDREGRPTVQEHEKPRAKEAARGISAKYRKDGLIPEIVGEIANEWHGRYLEVHERLGNQIAQHENDWNTHVATVLGFTPMASVTPKQIKAVRDKLTKLHLDDKMSAKRSMNLWSTLITAPFSRAFTEDDPKYSEVRVGPYAANPVLGIKPPTSSADRDEDERERQALDPAQALALLSCEALTLGYRRFYAVAMFSGLRPAELYGILWSDVRLDAQRPVIKVQRSRDGKTLEEKATKTRQSVRDVPIHPHLRPLLTVMRDEADDESANVFPIARAYEIERSVDDLRRHLLVAGIKETELQEGTDQLVPFDVRSFRTTFATWCSMAGYDSAWIAIWLGHKPKGTAAKHYVKNVPHFEDALLKPTPPGLVPPFPPLPESLLGSGSVSVSKAMKHPKNSARRWPLWDSNPDTLPSQRF